jgi:hypothetical protein
MLHLVFPLLFISCSSNVTPEFRPQSRSETSNQARQDAHAAIMRGDYRFLGYSGGIAPNQAADGLPGLSTQIRERLASLGKPTPSLSIRDSEEQMAWQRRYAALQSGKPKARRDLILGWDAPNHDIPLPSIGVVCAYFRTCGISEPWHSRRILYIKTYNRQMVRHMDKRGRSMWQSVGVKIR